MFPNNSSDHQSRNPFQSFWAAGYECADHINAHGDRVDLLAATGHNQMLEEDYAALRPFNIRTVREGIRWNSVEKRAYQYDWRGPEAILKAAQVAGVQVLWDICHFGFPDDCSPLHPKFSQRFAALCAAFVRWYRDHVPDGPLVITPINEASFLSWLCAEVGGAAPYAVRMGWDAKYHLMRAYIAGIEAMREVDPGVRILTTEPLMNLVPHIDATPAEVDHAARVHDVQFQALDMLCGRICPELGGTMANLDILGFNYYYNNQWIVGDTFLPWVNDNEDPRWRPLRSLFAEAWSRYQRPMALTETSHAGEHRPQWIRFVAEECAAAISAGIPLWGVCLYPIIDRPDWDNLSYWHHSGLWDANELVGPYGRVLCEPYAEALLEAQRMVSQAQKGLTTAFRSHIGVLAG
jgi:hypothetical protein